MFDTFDQPVLFATRYEARLDAWEAELVECEAEIARLRARQVWLVRNLDAGGQARRRGYRSTREYVAAACDVSSQTASGLVDTAESLRQDRVWSGDTAETPSFDRTVSMSRLVAVGPPSPVVEQAATSDIAGVGRLTVQQKRFRRRDERQVHRDRYFQLRPTLDCNGWNVSGFLPAVGGTLLEQRLAEIGDELPSMPDAVQLTRGQRNADALVQLAMSGASNEELGERREPAVTIFVDATSNAYGSYSAMVAGGPRVGPNTLEALLCSGRIEVTGIAAEGEPVAFGNAETAIPPRTRRFVLFRDGGCTADGCSSRYRLQPHHINPRAHDGNHDPSNLTTLCWFHHHVVVHQMGYTIDPASPRRRRRFIRPRWRDPPW